MERMRKPGPLSAATLFVVLTLGALVIRYERKMKKSEPPRVIFVKSVAC
jgi:hypothetical protein